MAAHAHKTASPAVQSCAPYAVNIDFDGASAAWRRNKVPVARDGVPKSRGAGGFFERSGQFVYVCGEPRNDGLPCHGPPQRWARTKRSKDPATRNMRPPGPCRAHADDEDTEET